MKNPKAPYAAPEIRRINLAAVELAGGSCKSVVYVPGVCKKSPTQTQPQTIGS